MEITRRSALAVIGGSGALAFGAQEISPAVVRRHDEAVGAALKVQITDPQSRGYGNVPLKKGNIVLGYYSAGAAAGLIDAFTAAYLCPASRYHGDSLLIERIKLAAGYLNRVQHPDGLIDFQDTNFDSTPDTGFTVWSAATAACLAKRHGQHEILSAIEPFLKKAAAGMVSGGIHTPNHRWVVSSALAQINEVFPDASYVRRIEQWLAEGIDIDGDGQFTERSSGTYNIVCDRALLVLALKLKRPELLDAVRRNLEAMLYLMHPNFEVVTEISHRQDRNTRTDMSGYWFPLRYLAIHDGNGEFAAVVNHYGDTNAGLSTLMEYPELNKALPPAARLPDHFAREMPELGIVRFRKGLVSATYSSQTPAVFAIRHGDAVVEAVRWASAFFGKGQFVGGEMRKHENGFSVAQELSAGYYQPLDPPQRVTPKNWAKLRRMRKQSNICSLTQLVYLEQTANGFALRFTAEGTPNVPVAIEINLREGSALAGCEPLEGESWLLQSGSATVTAGNQRLVIGPGSGVHRWTQLRGAMPRLPGRSVYVTGFTPFRHTLQFETS